VAIFIAAGCGSSSTPSASRPTDPGPAGSPSATRADGGSPSAPPSAWPTVTPLSASWVKPAKDVKIKDYRIDLTAATIGLATEVTFKVAWSGGSFAGCTAKKPTAPDTWSCTVDLLKSGVPPGKLTASFDVLDRSGKTSTNLAPSRTITYAVVPPKPVSTYKVVSQKYSTTKPSMVEVDKVTWTEPAGYATQFRLYGVKGCPNYAAKTNGKPCLVENMKLAAKDLELIKTVNGAARSITLTHTMEGEMCGDSIWCGAPHGSFGALVLRADNAYGQSVFTIVLSSDVCYDCVY